MEQNDRRRIQARIVIQAVFLAGVWRVVDKTTACRRLPLLLMTVALLGRRVQETSGDSNHQTAINMVLSCASKEIRGSANVAISEESR